MLMTIVQDDRGPVDAIFALVGFVNIGAARQRGKLHDAAGEAEGRAEGGSRNRGLPAQFSRYAEIRSNERRLAPVRASGPPLALKGPALAAYPDLSGSCLFSAGWSAVKIRGDSGDPWGAPANPRR
jgi:hypothetical protein